VRIGRQIGGCISLVVFCAFASLAQQVTVTGNVNLRGDPSTTNPPIELMHPRSILTLLDSTPQNGFYHVKAADGQEGWVWSKNISLAAVAGATIPTSTECDHSLWDHVYNPQRLIVKQDAWP